MEVVEVEVGVAVEMAPVVVVGAAWVFMDAVQMEPVGGKTPEAQAALVELAVAAVGLQEEQVVHTAVEVVQAETSIIPV